MRESVKKNDEVTSTYKIILTDIDVKGFILLRHLKKMTVDYQVDDKYVIENVKLIINPKSAVVLIGSPLTYLKAESERFFIE